MAKQGDNDYTKGLAFVVEGSTERVFYHEYLQWCCSNKPGTAIEQLPNKDFVIRAKDGDILIRFNVKGSVSSVPNALNWVRSTCLSTDIPWIVVLCYDTDGDVSLNLDTRAWRRFRQDLAKMGLPVIDLAADADIEDVILVDIEGVRRFLGLGPDVEPRGRKGKAKLKSLYKAVDVTRPYKSGERARNLIHSLSFDVIEERAPMGIKALRQAAFGTD
ncbi:hypothetical protein [Adlercreutzia sp. ZJ141]|uniref:hypothetical protein n=1 Tax=Adlercreutzia sp. ZJ141 TaxID=2709406 RepID=UPI0013EB3BD4|nr:hypothetical protein [Adlercreutzia sp. ZJ141]